MRKTFFSIIVSIFTLLSANGESLKDFVLNNFTATPVSSKFTPVVIYNIIGGGLCVTSLGSAVTINGKTRIITAEHIIYYGGYYAYNELNGPDAGKIRYISGISSVNTEITGELSDVIILDTGTESEKVKIKPTVEKKFLKFGPLTKIQNGAKLTSLFSGDKVQISSIATQLTEPGDGVEYYLLEYSSRDGQSGEGFVDENDNIYILKGKNSSGNTTFIYGPITF